MRNKLLLCFFLGFIFLVPIFSLSQQTRLQNGLENLSKLYAEKEKQDRIKLLQIAKQKGWALSLKSKNPHQVTVLTGVDINGLPVYTTTDNNIIAAATTHTNRLWQGGLTGFNLSGSSANIQGKIAMWDGGIPSNNHIELNGKIINKNLGSVAYHPTHVAGTLMATGINPLAKGMAYGAKQISCYSFVFNNDVSEMFSAASNLLVSNHSYGVVPGWNFTSVGDWEFNGSWGDTADYKFGIYDEKTQMFDSIAYNAAYYLIVKSVGNNRNQNGPDVGKPYRRYDATGTMIDAGNRPTGISYNNAYDVIPTYGVAKNILTVGAVEGIASGSTNIQDIKMAAFSNWGPTDDGRIKPDLVADGVDVLSCTNNSTTSYDEMNGTSMAAPNVTGSLYLLQELYSKKNAGAFMKAATLKALAIHTASEAGVSVGPDYQYGWGLLNAEKAAIIINSNNTVTSRIIESTLNNGATYSLNVIASGNGKLMATIVWTDPVGLVTTTNLLNNPSLKLIHDLDIRIIKGSNTYMPWVLDPVNPSAAATKGDNFRDNVERVEIDDIVPGETYTIQITHKGILQRGSQDFSLIVSGVGGIAYCNSSATQTQGTRIDNVTFAGLNNNNAVGCTKYNNYTNITAQVEPSATYPLSVSVSSCDGTTSSKVVKVFIDYNGNGNFTDAGETIATSGVITTSTNFTTNITTPNNLVIGNYSLMRVVVQETNDTNTVTPCNTYLFGETQDYRIQFISPSIDVAIANITIPTNNTCSNNNQYVSVLLSNVGKNPVSNIPLNATVKNGTTTIATLTGNYLPTLASGASVVYTFQTPFTSVGNNTYNITATANLATDQNIINNTNSADIAIASFASPATGQANVCGNTASLRAFNTNSNQNYLWYNDAVTTSPIAIGENTTTSTISNTYYIGAGISTHIGAVNKNVFSNGDYQAKGGNYFKYTSTVPVMLENAKMYTAFPGKITITVADIKVTAADGSYSYNTLSSTTIDALASRPTQATGDVAGNDPNDLGLVYNINLLLPSGNHAVIVSTDNIANVFRNNNITANPYPYSIPDVFTITGNNATNPEKFYYYLYNMSIKTLDCQSDRVAVIPTIAPAPVIAYSADSLVCTASINYQWKENGVDIAGANNQYYKPTINGNYSCFTTDNTGCQQLSNVLAYPPTTSGNIFTIYPNPANHFVDVKFVSSITAPTEVYVVDVLGRLCLQTSFGPSTGNFTKRVYTTALACGVYVVIVKHGEETYKQKLVVIR